MSDVARMTAMQLDAPGKPLRRVQRSVPTPVANELLVRVAACGVCRTDLHVIDGDVDARFPIIPGHEIIGRVDDWDAQQKDFRSATGLAFRGSAKAAEPVPIAARTVKTSATIPSLPAPPVMAAMRRMLSRMRVIVSRSPSAFRTLRPPPLLCAGLIGWRALRLAGNGGPAATSEGAATLY